MKLNKEMSEALRRYINGQNGVVCDTVEEFDDYLEICRSLGFRIGFHPEDWRNPGMCIRLGDTHGHEIHTGAHWRGREYTIKFKEIPSFFSEKGWIDGGELDVGSMPDPLSLFS